MPIDLSFFIGVFFAGVITTFLPCTFPVLLGYLGTLSGFVEKPNKKLILLVILFYIGFASTYTFLGSVSGLFGYLSAANLFFISITSYIPYIGGVLFIVIGLSVLQKFPLPNFMKPIRSIKLPKSLTIDKWWTPFIFGVIFATGWSPCIGPVLGSVLVLAGTSSSVGTGALLLLSFSTGIFATLLIFTFIYLFAREKIPGINRHSKHVQFVGGIFLILLGILLLTGNTEFLNSFVPEGYVEKYL